MCLAVPGKIISIEGDDQLERRGKVDFGGVIREAHLAYVPNAKVGDYVIVHVGFALSVLDEKEAQETLAYFDQYDDAVADAAAQEA
jgi:hydrogenase expression/formation protein HypC